MNLDELFSVLDAEDKNPSIACLRGCLERLNLREVGTLDPKFSPDSYTRSPIRKTQFYEALVLGWLPAQHSPIHNHKGSSCAFLVLEGNAIEETFELKDGRLIDKATNYWPTGSVVASASQDIHRISGGNSRMVTLHVYAPALEQMEFFTRGPNALRGT